MINPAPFIAAQEEKIAGYTHTALDRAEDLIEALRESLDETDAGPTERVRLWADLGKMVQAGGAFDAQLAVLQDLANVPEEAPAVAPERLALLEKIAEKAQPVRTNYAGFFNTFGRPLQEQPHQPRFDLERAVFDLSNYDENAREAAGDDDGTRDTEPAPPPVGDTFQDDLVLSPTQLRCLRDISRIPRHLFFTF
jgi:hypothetical protein